MKILLVHGEEYAGALASMGHKVFVYSPEQTQIQESTGVAEFSLQHAIEQASFEPDLVLIKLIGGRPLLNDLAACPYRLVAYVYDSMLNHFWLRHYLKLFDDVFVDCKDSLRRLAEEGVEAHWLPFGVDPALYPSEYVEKEVDVGFVGSVQGRPRRVAMLDLLREHFTVRAEGGWDSDEFLNAKQACAIYRRSRIVINELLFQTVTSRTFEAMASGSMLLTESCAPELRDFFTEGIHLDTFEPETLIEKVRYYLDHEEERERIAAAGRRKILAEHTLERRAEFLIEIVRSRTGRGIQRDINRRRVLMGQTAYHFCKRWPQFAATQIAAAVGILGSVLCEEPDNGSSLWMLGLTEAEYGDKRKAAELLERAAKQLPEEYLVLFHLGQLLLEDGDEERAIRHFRKGLGRIASLGDEALASTCAQLQVAKIDWRFWLGLGHLLDARGRCAELYAWHPDSSPFPFFSIAYFVRAYREGGGAEALMAIGEAHSHSGALWDATEVFAQAATESTQNPENIFRAGTESLKVFRRSQGLSFLSAAIRLKPALRGRLKDLPLRPAEQAALLSIDQRQTNRVPLRLQENGSGTPVRSIPESTCVSVRETSVGSIARSERP